jgi:hypothetical protein
MKETRVKKRSERDWFDAMSFIKTSEADGREKKRYKRRRDARHGSILA